VRFNLQEKTAITEKKELIRPEVVSASKGALSPMKKKDTKEGRRELKIGLRKNAWMGGGSRGICQRTRAILFSPKKTGRVRGAEHQKET